MIPNFDAFNKAMAPYHQILKTMDTVNKFAVPPQLQLNAAIANMAKLSIEHHLQPILDKLMGFESFGERIKELIEDTPASLLLIAEYGWYAELDNNFTYYEYLGSLVREDKIDKLDSYLSDHYRSNLKEIISALCERHNDRIHLFREIESTFENRLYSACITLTLTQIDGISKDAFKRPFFLTENDLPKIKKNLSKLSDSTIDLISSPLISQTPIMADQGDLKNYQVQLNRHAILHGSDKNFGSEINSLKCISFLKYFSDFLYHIES